VRRDKRTEVDEAARLHPNDWSSLEVRILDISANGFRAECEARVPVGSSVALEVAGLGRVHAHVSWRRGDRFGAKFDRAIDLSGCAWRPLDGQLILSRLLAERAGAHRDGRLGPELELRRKILSALPVKSVARG
jgi:PilZ domain